MRDKWWLLTVRFRMLLKRIAWRAYSRLDDIPQDLRKCVVVTCKHCGQPIDVIEGPRGILLQCLHCAKLYREVDCRIMTIGEAERERQPAYILA